MRPTPEFRLRLLATSDIHAHVMPHDYTSDRPLANVGLARTAHLIRKARNEEPNCLLFDNGDFLEGSPLGELIAVGGHLAAGHTHPVIAAMNAVGYDAVGLGNHDFSFGLDFLSRALSDARFPVLASNTATRLGADPLSDSPFHSQSLILERTLSNHDGATAPIRVGVLSFLPTQTAVWERKHLNGRIEIRDMLASARAHVPALRVAGADIIVVLCHAGISEATYVPGMENPVVPLAAIEGIDAVIGGHVHLAFPGPDIRSTPEVDNVRGTVHGKPVVIPGFRGSHLGMIDLDLALINGTWKVEGFRSHARPVADRNSLGQVVPLAHNDPSVEAAVLGCHTATVNFIRNPIGQSDHPMHSYFARVTDSAALDLIHKAQLDWLAETVAGTEFEHLPRLSAASPFKSGGRGGPAFFTDVPAGEIVLRHISDLYHFPNSIRALVVTGATVLDWLERSASQFRQLTPGLANQPLLDPETPSYRFDAISGLSYEIDISLPARYGHTGALRAPSSTRIRNLTHAGGPVHADALFVIATHSFRADCQLFVPNQNSTYTIAEPLTLNSDILRSYVMRKKLVTPRASHHWRIAPLPAGTSAWFDTGPHARAHLHHETHLNLEAMQETTHGFLRVRVNF